MIRGDRPICRTSRPRPRRRCASTSTPTPSSTSSAASTAPRRPTWRAQPAPRRARSGGRGRRGEEEAVLRQPLGDRVHHPERRRQRLRGLRGQRPAGQARRHGDGALRFTEDEDTTRYIDLNDPENPATAGENAGKNPRGIVIDEARHDRLRHQLRVAQRLGGRSDERRGGRRDPDQRAARPGSDEEVVQVGAEMFFSSRGHFDRPGGTTVSTDERLSSEGWQACASCHFEGLTDAVVWVFGAGPRKSVPLNATFNPAEPGRAANPQLLRDLRRGRGLRAQHPQRLRPGPAAPAPRRRPSIRTTACCSTTAATSTSRRPRSSPSACPIRSPTTAATSTP